MRQLGAIGLFVTVITALLCQAEDGGWMKQVPEAERTRVNPYARQADAIAAGKRLFEEHCAKCHGENAMGKRKRPSLRSGRVRNSTDGEIFWLLKNGNLRKGMPAWAGLPEPMRWQIVAYVKSIGPAAAADTERCHDAEKP